MSRMADQERVWPHTERLQDTNAPPKMTGWTQDSFEDRCVDNVTVRAIPPVIEDISSNVAISGVQIYRISYASSNGKTRFILLVLSNNFDLFEQLFSVPKTKEYKDYKWDSGPEWD